jgi:hypothetical protein
MLVVTNIEQWEVRFMVCVEEWVVWAVALAPLLGTLLACSIIDGWWERGS